MPEINRRAQATDIHDVRGQIEFLMPSIFIHYDPDREICGGPEPCAEPGQTVAVVGPTGQYVDPGRAFSTAFTILQWPPVRIDGDIRDNHYARRSLRAAVGNGGPPMGQRCVNDTIGYNIAYARPGCLAVRDRAGPRAMHRSMTSSRAFRSVMTRWSRTWIESFSGGGEAARSDCGGPCKKPRDPYSRTKRPSALDKCDRSPDLQAAAWARQSGRTTLVVGAQTVELFQDADLDLVTGSRADCKSAARMLNC